jgi:hypothetical protein
MSTGEHTFQSSSLNTQRCRRIWPLLTASQQGRRRKNTRQIHLPSNHPQFDNRSLRFPRKKNKFSLIPSKKAPIFERPDPHLRQRGPQNLPAGSKNQSSKQQKQASPRVSARTLTLPSPTPPTCSLPPASLAPRRPSERPGASGRRPSIT